MAADRVLISVRGTMYETSRSTLDRYPNTLLARKATQLVERSSKNNTIILYCRAEVFDAVLFYYQSNGILSRPCLLSPEEFVRECCRFELDEEVITKVKKREGLPADESKPELEFRCNTQRLLYNVMESDAGVCSLIYLTISSVMVLASVVTACIVTMPSVRASRDTHGYQDLYFYIEFIMNIIFCIEYVLRLAASPKKFEFLTSGLNIIDLLAFLPFFIVLGTYPSKIHEMTSLKIARIVRIVRIIRLSTKSNTMGTVVNILQNCFLDILTMCMYILLTSVFWASMVYYAEMAETNTLFKSIPDSMWWAIQTVLTIGYGDIIPKTAIGKTIGSAVTVLAAFTLTVPLLSLGGKLLNLYSKKFHVDIGPDIVLEEME